MAKVSADRKLELVRTLRMQNHYNRQLFRTREGILYSQPDPRYGELYGLEGGDRSASCRKGKTHCGKLSDPVRDRYGFTPFLYFV